MFWETKKSERENEELDANLTEIIEGLAYRANLMRFLRVCILGNVVIWASVLLMPDFIFRYYSLISRLSDKLGLSVLVLPFTFGLFAAYCLFRLKMPDIEENKNLDSEMMASFQYQTHSSKRWLVWLFSILIGVLNVALLIMTTLFLSGALRSPALL